MWVRYSNNIVAFLTAGFRFKTAIRVAIATNPFWLQVMMLVATILSAALGAVTATPSTPAPWHVVAVYFALPRAI
jgi:hypothetical protein